jgi:hypothetical protein
MSYAESCTRLESEFTTIPVDQCLVPLYPFKHFVQECLDELARLLKARKGWNCYCSNLKNSVEIDL